MGLAAWILEKFHGWTDCGGNPDSALSKDEMLTNILIYWWGCLHQRLAERAHARHCAAVADTHAHCVCCRRQVRRAHRQQHATVQREPGQQVSGVARCSLVEPGLMHTCSVMPCTHCQD